MLSSKVAIVTGASSGIGRAIALAYGAAGARLVVSDTNSEGGKETVGLIRKSGGTATFIAADVSRAQECESLVARTVAEYHRLSFATGAYYPIDGGFLAR